MTELLLLPSWNLDPTPLSEWVETLVELGYDAKVERESAGVSWLEIEALKLRGYAVMDGLTVEAINFELEANDPSPARHALEQAAATLSWEVHQDDEDDADDE